MSGPRLQTRVERAERSALGQCAGRCRPAPRAPPLLSRMSSGRPRAARAVAPSRWEAKRASGARRSRLPAGSPRRRAQPRTPQVNFFARDEHDSLPNYKLLQSGFNALNITRVRAPRAPAVAAAAAALVAAGRQSLSRSR